MIAKTTGRLFGWCGRPVALTACAGLLFLTPDAAAATAPQDLPSGWHDIGTGFSSVDGAVETARRAVADEELWLGYTFALRDGVRIGCDGGYGRNISFESDGLRIHLDDEDREVGCDERFGLFLRFPANDQTIHEARLMPLRRAGRRLQAPVVWAGVVEADESSAWLRPVILGERGTTVAASIEVRERLLQALVLHAAADVEGIVLAALEAHQPADLRESAVFWVSRTGADVGLRRLFDVARSDPSDDVRKAAVFWLGQIAGGRATANLAEIAVVDPSTEVQESAVFALSQSPDDEATEHLIRIVRTHENRQVVRAALLWLGERGDERSIALFEELIFGRR